MPTTTSKSGSVVGLFSAQAWLVGSDGYPYGTAGEGAVAGTTTHARLLAFPKSAAVPSPARVTTALKGGNRWLGAVQFGIDDVGNFPLILENTDADFHAMATNSAVDQTSNTRWSQFADNINLDTLPQLGLMFSTIWQSREDGSDGVNLYVNYIIPRCQVQPNFAPMAYQAEGETQYIVTPTMSGKDITGKALSSSAGMRLRGGKTVMYCIVSPKPLALTTFIADGTETDIVHGFKPTSTIITLNAAANQLSINGVLTALSSTTIATSTSVLAAPGTSGQKDVILYETDFEAAA